MPTKDELQAENDELRERIAEIEATNGEQAGAVVAPKPSRPSFGLSAGEAADLEASGATTSPFTGQPLNAIDEGIEPATPRALRNAEQAKRRTEALPAVPAPLSGPPPAEGGPTGASVSTGDVASTGTA